MDFWALHPSEGTFAAIFIVIVAISLNFRTRKSQGTKTFIFSAP